MSPAEKHSETIANLKAAEINEPIAKFLGMKLVELTLGYAKITMQLKPNTRISMVMCFAGLLSPSPTRRSPTAVIR